MLSTERNYASYRAHLVTVPSPHLPFVALLLADLMSVDEAPDYDDDGALNAHKLGVLSKILRVVERAQLTPYTFAYVPVVAQYVAGAVLSQDELHRESKLIEPAKEAVARSKGSPVTTKRAEGGKKKRSWIGLK
jgi:hypothetical protein